MTSILRSPLPIRSLVKSVCGLTRLMNSVRSASSAGRDTKTRMSFSVRPISMVSIEALIGAPADSSVIPKVARISFCPSAVAPPWLPIAGKMNGRAPSDLSFAIAAVTTVAIWSMPRLPTATATDRPVRSTSEKTASSCAAVSAPVSCRRWSSSLALTSICWANTESDDLKLVSFMSRSEMVVEYRLKYSSERRLEPDFSFKSVRDFTTTEMTMKLHRKISAVILCAAVALLCGFGGKGKATLKKEVFGKTADGQGVDIYTLTNANGVEARITNYGGIVVSLKTPDRN